MENLDKYFMLFDEARTNEEARRELINIFTEDMSFSLGDIKKSGIDEWKKFLDLIYTNNMDLKHMYDGWKLNKETNKYETRWAICGKRKDGSVYTGEGIDIAELDFNGKIKDLQNSPDNPNLFKNY